MADDRVEAGRRTMNRRGFLTGTVSGLALASVGRTLPAWAQAGGPPPPGYVRLRVVQDELTIEGKTGKVYRIEQDDGALGWSGARGDRFKVVVDNTVAEPFSIHWHGIILPNGQDGVPYVTQSPIKPGERRLYDFPLVQVGTYWMHSHFGLQEQSMLTAPLIIREPPGAPEMKEVLVVLNDFTTRDPSAILADLRRGSMAGMKMAAGGTKTTESGMKMSEGGMKMGGSATKTAMKADLTDVSYDALLANRRPLSDPDLARVTPGETVRLRIINMTSGTNVFLSTGRLAAEAIAVDGEDIVPLPGTRFELGVAQRIDLRVRIPSGQTAYPITTQAEGTDMLAGVVLATAGAAVPALSTRAPKPAGALTNRQESRLRSLRPLAAKPVDHRLSVTLGGDMAAYVWSLNGQVWPKITPLEVKQGERVELSFVNQTMMTHPMHLHGHVFQVTEVGGARLRGAKRDTVLVSPRQTVKVEFDALYQGYWMIHCHLLYHQAAGMMTVLHYQGFTNGSYDPLASAAEFPRR
jgi:FtsP/CotA-like multicopper oxidase with cupredoxin domain